MPGELKNYANMAFLLSAVADQVTGAVRVCLQDALPDGGKVAVGYSGGMDSTVLLGAARSCAAAGINICAVHVNHQLHADANKWQRHCQRRCKLWQVPLQATVVELDPQRSSLEERARAARRAVFAATDADAVLLAHHADDQAETCLLRVLRGSGVTGLAAMRKVSILHGSNKLLLRPLLEYRRAILRCAASALRVRGIRDPSNYLLDCNRNWLRHAFLPAAEARLPGPTQALNRLAANAQQTEKLLNELACMDDIACRSGEALQHGRLIALGEARVRNWLRWSLQQQQVVLGSGKHLNEAARQLCVVPHKLVLSFGAAKLVASQGRLVWQRLN